MLISSNPILEILQLLAVLFFALNSQAPANELHPNPYQYQPSSVKVFFVALFYLDCLWAQTYQKNLTYYNLIYHSAVMRISA